MARINLLPWRAERRKQRKKEFLGMLGMSAIAAVVVSFLIISYYSSQISGQEDRNSYVREQITQVDAQIKEIEELDKKKAKLLARKEVIEQLQANRSQMVHLFDALVHTIPDGVVLTAIQQEGNKLTLTGRSQSNARVSTYMRTLEGSGWMTKPDLSIIEAKAGDPGLPYTFTMTVTMANPNTPTDTDGDGVPDAPADGAYDGDVQAMDTQADTAGSNDAAELAPDEGKAMAAPVTSSDEAAGQVAPGRNATEQAAPEQAKPQDAPPAMIKNEGGAS